MFKKLMLVLSILTLSGCATPRVETVIVKRCQPPAHLMLTPEELAQLPASLSLDDVWVAGLNDDQHMLAVIDKQVRLQTWIREHCNDPVPPPAEPPKRKLLGIF